jgi:hypothetical protein
MLRALVKRRGSTPGTASPAGCGVFTDNADLTRRKLLRVVEIAEILGVSKQRADQLRRQPASGRSSPRNVWWKGPLARRSPGKATLSWLLDRREEAGDRSPRRRYTLGLSGSRERSDSPLDRGSELAVVHFPVLRRGARSGQPATAGSIRVLGVSACRARVLGRVNPSSPPGRSAYRWKAFTWKAFTLGGGSR